MVPFRPDGGCRTSPAPVYPFSGLLKNRMFLPACNIYDYFSFADLPRRATLAKPSSPEPNSHTAAGTGTGV